MRSSMFQKRCGRPVALMVVLLHLMVFCAPANAISIKEELQLSQEFMRMLRRNFELIEDPVVAGYVNGIGQKILSALPPQPFNYQFFVIKEDVYNAFAIPAGYIFVNSGLFLAMDSEEELAGILSHEISHVVCRHISQRIEREKKIGLATMAGMVAGIFLGAAGGNTSAASAIAIGSTAAGQSLSLAFSRDDEAQADQLGLGYLKKTGYSAKGLLEILKKIRNKQWFGSEQIPTYVLTHPAVEERIVYIDSWIATNEKDSSTTAQPKSSSHQFKRIQNRLRALYGNPTAALQYFSAGLTAHPDDTDYAYGYALALSRTGNHEKAIDYLQRALAKDALDPILLGDLGRIYFLEGRTDDSLRVLQGAASLNSSNPDILFYLGRSYMSQGNYAEAANTFESLISQHKNHIEAYYFLGESYGKLDQVPNAHFFLGLYHLKKGDLRTAFFHLERAQKTLKDPSKLETVNQALKSIGKLPVEEEKQ